MNRNIAHRVRVLAQIILGFLFFGASCDHPNFMP
jgi:hypothetical protein